MESFNTDWMKKYRGASACALRPTSTSQVAALLAHCNSRRLAVCPQVCVSQCGTRFTTGTPSAAR